MSRGQENQPKHAPPGEDCKIVLWEQDSHRDVSRGNGKGFIGGTPGVHWQSHHIVCVSSMGSRIAKDAATKLKLEKSLYITDWNINKAPNMIGLPQRCQYRLSYGGAEDGITNWRVVTPKNKPSHNNDHNTTDGYTDEVSKYLQENIWDKFDASKGDHKADATWLKGQLEDASKHFEELLIERGKRDPGTVKAWKDRFNLQPGWEDPFSMADVPTQRSPGKSIGDLTNIFQRL
jgi:hypothetical protein